MKSQRVFVEVRSEPLDLPEECYFLVESPEEARVVQRIAGPESRRVTRERFRHLSKVGEAHDHQLPDIARVLETAIELRARARGVCFSRRMNETRDILPTSDWNYWCELD